MIVGYFAYAQYDVLFLHVILNAVKNPTEEPTRCILYSLWSWDISLALNMTYSFLLVIARHGVPRQSLGVKYGVYAAYFFRGIATLALAMTRKFSRSVIRPTERLLRYTRKDSVMGSTIVQWDISLALNMTERNA